MGALFRASQLFFLCRVSVGRDVVHQQPGLGLQPHLRCPQFAIFMAIK